MAVTNSDSSGFEPCREQGADRHKDHSSSPPDFSGQDLSSRDFSSQDLRGARFFRCNLKGSNFMNADLEGADFTGADLTEANMENANLKNAGLAMAVLNHTRLFGVSLFGATLTKCSAKETDFSCADMRHARIRECRLKSAHLVNADLRDCDLSLSDVSGCDFSNSDLRNARLRLVSGYKTAIWHGVDIRDINFAGAYRMRRHIMDENYICEFKRSSGMSKLVYYVWWATSDCGRSLARWFAWVLFLCVVFSLVYTKVGIDCGEHETWLSPFYFSVVTLTTLGFGDVVPTTVAGQVAVILEVFAGYVMLGGLLSIFSNKLARRAE